VRRRPIRRRLPAVEWRVEIAAGTLFNPTAAPFRFSLYGGLPTTTVIGCSRLTLFASRRDLAIASTICGNCSSSTKGLPSVSVMKRLSSAAAPFRLRQRRISASRRNCATANGPNCSSKPNSRFAAAAIAGRRRPRPDPLDIGGDAPERAEQEGPVPTAGSASVTSEEASPAARSTTVLARPDRRGSPSADDFRRRVVGARELAQAAVVDFEKMLVEIEPRFRLILAERRPVHFVQDARQRAERCFERLLVGFVFGQNVERRPISVFVFLSLIAASSTPSLSGISKARAISRPKSPPGRSHRELRVAGVGNSNVRQSSFRCCRLPWPPPSPLKPHPATDDRGAHWSAQVT